MQLRRVIGVSSIIILFLSASANAQQPPGYMERLKNAEAAALVPSAGAMQRLANERAFAGDTAGAIAAYDGPLNRNLGVPSEAQLRLVDEAGVEDAIAAIVAQARTRRVVLINELHHMPMHRAFAQRLARELRKIGYNYLACETFDSGYPVAFSGGYFTRDPIFGGWIAEAIADGWKLVAYEKNTPSEQPAAGVIPAQRERVQAQNLVERIFAKDPNAKVLIHVGLGHLYKGTIRTSNGQEVAMMGEQLHRMTGLEMLHVDQTWFYAHPDAAHDHPLYARMVAKSSPGAPFVLKSKEGGYAVTKGYEDKVDMQVIFPRYAFSDANGRPEWLASLAGRTPRAIPRDLLPTTGRRAILAYRAGEPADAVPADVVLVEAGKPAPELMLPKGEFRFASEE